MKKAELQYSLDVLLAKMLFIYKDHKQYINWAIELLQAEVENENLYILAGLDDSDSLSMEKYFTAATEELDLKTDRTTEELFHIATSIIAQEVIDGKMQPRKGLTLMERISKYTVVDDYLIDSLYQFEDLAEDLSLLGEYNLYYSGLTLENIDEVIIDEMKMFLIAQSRGWKDITNLIYCDKCKSFSRVKYKKKGWLIKKYIWSCEECDSLKYLDWHKVENRKLILEKIEDEEKLEKLKNVEIKLIPVLELWYLSDSNTSRPESYPYWLHADEWDKYNSNCLLSNSFSNMTPYINGSRFYQLSELNDNELLLLIKNRTENYKLEEIYYFDGGYILNMDGKDYLFPQCCSTLGEIENWIALSEGDGNHFWEGHPWPDITIDNNKITFDLTHDDFDEYFEPTPIEEVVTVHRLALKRAVDRLKIEMSEFADRINNINNKENLGFEKLDQILIGKIK